MIVKAEILWTRLCPLRCHYCGMVTGARNTPTIEFWKEGLDNLKKLECSFIAIYGAEPLADFEKLPEFVRYTRQLDIPMTLITSGCVAKVKDKLKQLYNAGLRSLTTSYDVIPLDSSSAAKTNRALGLLTYFKRLGSVDNVAVVITLTKKNYTYLYDTAVRMTEHGIWTFFDIIHPNRKQPGSKSKGYDKSLLFSAEDLPNLVDLFKRIKDSKQKLKIHASNMFLDFLIDCPQTLLVYNWNCADYKCFPSWVTVNCDGMVYPCDDFQPQYIGVPFNRLHEYWSEASKLWTKVTTKFCPGCIWNTHLDAHFIKEGLVNINEYVHK